MITCINGKFVDGKKAKISIFDHGLLYGDGIFDTIIAVNGKIFWLEEHIDRLLEGCRRIYLDIPWSKKQLIDLTKKTFKKNKQKNGRIRITITRGINGIPIYSTKNCKPNLIIFSSKLIFPNNEVYEKGIKLKIIKEKRVCPITKNLSFLPSILSYIKAKKLNFDDAIFINENNKVAEGTTFNIFVIKRNKINTPYKGILRGITAKKAIELAQRNGFKVIKKDTSIKELISADEVFITGTTKKIMPVVQIDKNKINKGKPGPITKQLMSKFNELYF